MSLRRDDLPEFDGFKPPFFRFLKQLRANNNKPWFNENKQRYKDEVETPMLAFIQAMQPVLAEISSHYRAIPKVNGGSMFRIYRDARYVGDRPPLKEQVACQFRHELGRDAHAPGFYLQLKPGEIRLGGGIWRPSSKPLRQIRTTILDSPNAWNRILQHKDIRKRFGGISGDQLKTYPRGFDPEAEHIDDIRRKSFFLMATLPESAARSADFTATVGEHFRAATPLFEFLSHALDIPF